MILASLLGCLAHAESDNIHLDLKEAEAAKVFRLMAQITQQDVVVPACAAEQKLTLRLEIVPPELVWGVLEQELDLRIDSVGGTRVVQCAPRVELGELAETRVSVDARGMPATEVLEELAVAAGLELRAEVPDFPVSLVFEDVRLGSALPVVAEALHLAELRVEEGVLVAGVQRSLDGSRLGTAELEEALSTLPECGALVGLSLSASGEVVGVEELDGACPIEVVAGEPAVWVTTRLPSPGLEVFGEDQDIEPLLALLEGIELLEEPRMACEAGCEVVLTTPDNASLAEAMTRLERRYTEVYLVEIQPGPRGGKQGRISFSTVPAQVIEER